ncbi:Zn-ribbon-containing protein [Verrucomicrobia bacterium]|nr:Zn-ribbon-containing protein [Verrucomicrobiota bacterium]
MQLKDEKYDGNDFISMSTSMLQLGFILSEPRELRRNPSDPKELQLICTFVDSASIRLWKASNWYRDQWKPRFKKHLRGVPKLVRWREVIQDIDDKDVCGCKEWPSFLLYPNCISPLPSAVHCGRCRHPVPSYKLPDGIDHGWERVHDHIYNIWLSSGLLESWAESQLGDYQSDLNREAIKVIDRLRKFRKVPAYYQIWQEEGDYFKGMPCPSCGKKGSNSPWDYPVRLCGKCKLAFGY